MLQTPGGFELTVLVIVVGFVFFAIVAVGITLLGGYVIYNGVFVENPDVEGDADGAAAAETASGDSATDDGIVEETATDAGDAETGADTEADAGTRE